jgi:hypothetical protein
MVNYCIALQTASRRPDAPWFSCTCLAFFPYHTPVTSMCQPQTMAIFLEGREPQPQAQPVPRTNCRLAHIFHALVSTLLVAATLGHCPDFIETHISVPGQSSILHAVSPLSIASMSFSLGYFIADLLIMQCTIRNTAMLVHHIGGLVALLATLTSGLCHFYGLLLLSTELTTPFICFRWYMDRAGRKGTQLYVVNGACILVGWLLSRILLFFYIFLHMWDHRAVISQMVCYVKARLPS